MITEGIMASHGCYLCLLLFTVILIEPSEAGCMDYFTKKGLANALSQLPENIPVKIMNKPEDIVVHAIKKHCKENFPGETRFLWECFKEENNMDYKPTCNETEESISVPFYHFMCLTSIAKRLRDTTKPPEVCEVYKKVCGEDSATPGPQEGICSEKETGSDIQKILIGVLIATNFIVPMAVYLYMRNQIQQIPNLREEVRKTEIQQNTFPRDVEEGSVLLMTPESSIIINSPENTII